MLMIYDWERFFEAKLREIAKEDRIIDVGGGCPFQKRMARYKQLFKNKKYETLDISPTYNPTIVGDAHNLPLPNESIPAILSFSTLEHLQDPGRAVNEMHRVLRRGGKVFIYVPFIYPYHALGDVFGDYFRFTEEGLRCLFRKFSTVEIKKQGGYFHALSFFSPGQQYTRFFWEPIAYALDKIFKTEKRSTTAGYYLYAVK